MRLLEVTGHTDVILPADETAWIPAVDGAAAIVAGAAEHTYSTIMPCMLNG